MGYNALFTDGSVKTFSDAGASLFKQCKLIRASVNNCELLRDINGLFEQYFDPLYAQD
jgi:hypothetical protein